MVSRPVLTAASSQPCGPRKSTMRRPARFSFSTRAASASTAANAAGSTGASLRFSRSSAISAPQAADASEPSRLGGLPPARPSPPRPPLASSASAASSISMMSCVLEQVAAHELVEGRRRCRRSHSSVIIPCSTSSLRLCSSTALSAGSVQASARCWYQSIASSSSMSESSARCRFLVSPLSSSAGSCRPSWLMRWPIYGSTLRRPDPWPP